MELKIDNMTCGGCVSSVKRILSKQLGVGDEQITVDLASGRATVPELPRELVEVAIDKLGQAGFPAATIS